MRGAQFIPRTALTPHAAVWGSCCCPTRQLASSRAARWHLPNETGGSKAPCFHIGTWKEGITARNDAMGHLDFSKICTILCRKNGWEDQWAKPCNKSCPPVQKWAGIFLFTVSALSWKIQIFWLPTSRDWKHFQLKSVKLCAYMIWHSSVCSHSVHLLTAVYYSEQITPQCFLTNMLCWYHEYFVSDPEHSVYFNYFSSTILKN